jgi:hypothetical protein
MTVPMDRGGLLDRCLLLYNYRDNARGVIRGEDFGCWRVILLVQQKTGQSYCDAQGADEHPAEPEHLALGEKCDRTDY